MKLSLALMLLTLGLTAAGAAGALCLLDMPGARALATDPGLIFVDSDDDEGGDDEHECDDDDEDEDEDGCGLIRRNGAAPAGPVTPPKNGLFTDGTAPQVKSN